MNRRNLMVSAAAAVAVAALPKVEERIYGEDQIAYIDMPAGTMALGARCIINHKEFIVTEIYNEGSAELPYMRAGLTLI